MDTPICLRCIHLDQEEIDPYYETDFYGRRTLKERTMTWFCKAKWGYIGKIPNKCKRFQPITQTKWTKGEDNMVKLDEIPAEQARLDLANLPSELTLIAVSERMQEEQAGKTGGLVITYRLEDGKEFNQKYSKVSGAELTTACKRLKIKDTLDLQKAWYKYKLTQMRIGFPRMLPVEKVKEA